MLNYSSGACTLLGVSHPIWYVFLAPQTVAAGFTFSVNFDALTPLFGKTCLQLTSLDMEVVSEESKGFANTVFLKKSMYYNMRSRIVKRHAGHVIRKAS